jgi:FtsP/CotA-like multicopper oxidase with cupredoxin domain
VKEGDLVRVTLENALPAPTSIHWHGLPLRGRNGMDGVPDVTQQAIQPGETFLYEFAAEPAGTFFFHLHFGLQLDHGLYAPLIIEPKRETLSYDREYVLVLDDWPARPPEAMLADLRGGRSPVPEMNMAMEGAEVDTRSMGSMAETSAPKRITTTNADEGKPASPAVSPAVDSLPASAVAAANMPRPETGPDVA